MAYSFSPAYPTPQHERAAERITFFFSGLSGVEAVLLTNSCARGKATRDSCLDIGVLLRPGLPGEQVKNLEAAWELEYASQPVYAELKSAGLFSHVDLDITQGVFFADGHGWTSGADEFELEIGNLLSYSSPLWVGGGYLRELQEQWLPYYGEDLRESRLQMVREFFVNNLDHIPPFIERGLYFQAFNRLYHAFSEFLQGLFIYRRVYPIAYDKWVCEQVVDILELPELYPQLPRLLEIEHFESKDIAQKAKKLRALYDQLISA